MDLEKLQVLFSRGRWTVKITGNQTPETKGPDECVEFILKNDCLTFSHAHWICIYNKRDTAMLGENTATLEIVVPSGVKKLHQWTREMEEAADDETK